MRKISFQGQPRKSSVSIVLLRHRSFRLISWSVGWIILVAGSVSAQVGRNRALEGGPASEIIVAPREVLSFVEEAKKDLAKKNWAEATQALGSVLGLEAENEDFDQDYFLGMDGEGVASGSLRTLAMQMMEGLPEEGAKFAELRFGVTAKNALDAALAGGDLRGILEVSRKFGFTTAGRKALWLSIEEALGQGQMSIAAAIVERLMGQPLARKEFGPELGLLGAACWKAANQSERAEDVLEKANGYWPKASVNWGGRTIRLGGNQSDRQAILQTLRFEGLDISQPRNREWPLPGGRADNNAHGFAGPVMPILRWHVELHPSPQDKGSVSYKVNNHLTEKDSLMPTRFPLVLGKTIFVRTYDQRTLGIDELTGKVLWDQAFEGFPIRLLTNSFGSIRNDSEIIVSDKLLAAVWAEGSLGLLSSDGDRLFGVCEVSASQAAQNLVLGANVTITRAASRANHNVLRCWSIARQGAIEWEVGGNDGLSAPELAGALFLGPPTPWEDSLLVLGELNGEVYLIALEASTGKWRWQQQLVANTASPIATDVSRRSLAASPVIQGNVVVCPTLSGLVVGYNLTDRTLLWAQRYSSQQANYRNVNIFGAAVNDNYDPLVSRAMDASITIVDGVVLALPNDAESGLFALDLYSGKELWKIGQREPWRYLGGVFQDHVLLVGDRQLLAVGKRDGNSLWKTPLVLQEGAKVAGRGARNDGKYFLPTTNQEILQVDIVSGAIVDRHRVESLLGNLVSTDSALVSFGPTEVNYFVLRDRLRTDVDIEFLKDRGSPWAMAKKGELQFAEGDLPGAIETIIQAYEREPENTDIQQLLAKVGIAAVRSDFERYAPLLPKFEKVMSVGKEQELYLTIMVDGFLKKGELAKAFERLLLISDKRIRQRMSHNADLEMINPTKGWEVQLDRWVMAQMERIWEEAPEGTRQEIRSMLEPRVQRSVLDPLPLRRSFTHLWRLDPVAKVSLEIGKELKRIDEWSGAADIFEYLMTRPDRQIAAQAAVEMAGIYLATGMTSSAHRLLSSSEFRSEPAMIDFQDRLSQLSPLPSVNRNLALSSPFNAGHLLYAMRKEDLNSLGKRLDQWKSGQVDIQSVRPEQAALGKTAPFQPRFQQGHTLADWNLLLTTNEILFINPWGQEIFSTTLDFPMRAFGEVNYNAYVVNHRVHLEMPGEILAVDAFQACTTNQSSVVRTPLGRPSDLESSPMRRGSSNQMTETTQWGETKKKVNLDYALLAACDVGVIARTGDEIICFDPQSRQRLWTRRGISRTVTASRDGYQLALFDTAMSTFSVLDCRDGSTLRTAEWKSGFEVKLAAGDRILCDSKDANRGGSFRLVDWQKDSVVLERSFPANTLATTVDDRYLVVYVGGKPEEGNGQLYLWDMQKGVEYQQALDLGSKPIKELRAMAFTDRILLLPFCSAFDIETEVMPSVSDPEFRPVAGQMMAISKDDGRLLWHSTVPTFKYFAPVFQSRNSPVLTLVRRLKLSVSGDQPASELTSIALVDIRTGETLFHDDVLPLRRNSGFSQRIYPDSETILVGYGGQSVELQFTDEEPPPSPIGPLGFTTRKQLRLEERMRGKPAMPTNINEGLIEINELQRQRQR